MKSRCFFKEEVVRQKKREGYIEAKVSKKKLETD